jgi:hypothetical protein
MSAILFLVGLAAVVGAAYAFGHDAGYLKRCEEVEGLLPGPADINEFDASKWGEP